VRFVLLVQMASPQAVLALTGACCLCMRVGVSCVLLQREDAREEGECGRLMWRVWEFLTDVTAFQKCVRLLTYTHPLPTSACIPRLGLCVPDVLVHHRELTHCLTCATRAVALNNTTQHQHNTGAERRRAACLWSRC
jgi:hypothetical protein